MVYAEGVCLLSGREAKPWSLGGLDDCGDRPQARKVCVVLPTGSAALLWLVDGERGSMFLPTPSQVQVRFCTECAGLQRNAFTSKSLKMSVMTWCEEKCDAAASCARRPLTNGRRAAPVDDFFLGAVLVSSKAHAHDPLSCSAAKGPTIFCSCLNPSISVAALQGGASTSLQVSKEPEAASSSSP